MYGVDGAGHAPSLFLRIGKTANSRVFVVLKPVWEGRMTQL